MGSPEQSKLFSPVGLNEEALRRAALVLQGNYGTRIRDLKFSRDPEVQEKEVNHFLTAVNGFFANLVQFVRTGDFIVPIVVNPKAEETNKRALPSNLVALALIVLLFSMSHPSGPTEGDIRKFIQMSKLSPEKLPRLRRDLEEMRWINVVTEGTETYWKSTNVLRACIPEELVGKVLDLMGKNPEERAKILSLLPEDYIRARKLLRIVKQDDLNQLFKKSSGE